MGALGAAMDAVFLALGEDGTFLAAPGGTAAAVSLLLTSQDEAQGFFAGRVRAPAWKVEVRQVQLATKPASGARFAFTDDGVTVVVEVRSTASAVEGLTWICDCDPITVGAAPVGEIGPAMYPLVTIAPVFLS